MPSIGQLDSVLSSHSGSQAVEGTSWDTCNLNTWQEKKLEDQRGAFLHFTIEVILVTSTHGSLVRTSHLPNLKHKRLGGTVFLYAQEEKHRIGFSNTK